MNEYMNLIMKHIKQHVRKIAGKNGIYLGTSKVILLRTGYRKLLSIFTIIIVFIPL